MRLALYQPDIPQNTGTMLRLAACFGTSVDIIEPCGFILDDKRMRRSGMDYIDQVAITRHQSWQAFQKHRLAEGVGRLILLSAHAGLCYTACAFRPDDSIMVGRESAGVPDDVRDAADLCVRIPMAPPTRSLNVAMAAAIVLAEALRQTNGFPQETMSP